MDGTTQVIKSIIPPQRVVLCVFGFLAIVNAYTMRLCLDITLGEIMAISSQNTSSTLVSFDREVQSNTKTKSSYRNFTWLPIKRPILSKLTQNPKHNAAKVPQPIFQADMVNRGWSKQLQTIILASFYVGYCCSHVPGGLLAEKCGGKWVLGLAHCMAAILTLLTPMVVRFGGAFALIVIRFLIGLSEGPTFPALSVLLASWVPSQERGKLGVFVFSGGRVGVFVMNLMSGVLEWPQVFYFFGGCALIWFVGFVFLCFDEPELNPFIDDSEKQYLQQAIPVLVPKINDARATPWQEIFTSAPMWAVITATVQYDWSQVQFATDVPQFVKDMERTSLSESFIISVNATAPHLLNWGVSLMAGFVSDFLVNRNILSTTAMRKIMTLIAGFGPNVLKSLASCITCNEHNGILAVYNCAIAVMGTYYAGIKLSPLDISPNYAGTLMGIANGLGSLTNAVAPYVADLVSKESQLPFAELRAVLWLVCTALITGDVQDFDNPEALLDKNK